MLVPVALNTFSKSILTTSRSPSSRLLPIGSFVPVFCSRLPNSNPGLIKIIMASYSSTGWPSSISISAPVEDKLKQEVLTPDCLEFLKKLHANFEPSRQELLAKRIERQKAFDAGERPDFLASTKHIRDGNWEIAPQPAALQRRWVEITGPVDKKMVVNALNSGSDTYMADFEDSNAPTWSNQLNGQLNLKDAIRRRIDFEISGKAYKLKPKVATLLVRPRGWHLDEKHIKVDGQRLSGSLFDFGTYFFHNAQELLSTGLGPYFYLPKLEGHLEARLWNDVFVFSQQQLGVPQGTIKATVLIETIISAFEMDEILYELKEHSSGLNAGRWDYIFSCIKKFRNQKDLCFPDRGLIGMTNPFMRAYALLLVKTCHRRKAPAIGGMSALIPIKNDEAANEKALGGVREDKARDARDGFDGGWVAHPGLVELARVEFEKVLGNRANQIDKQLPEVNVTAQDLLNFQPVPPVMTEHGLRLNVTIALQYLGAWLAGTGCVPINNLMEDAATAEISRSQLWQWIHSPIGILADGRKVTPELVNSIVQEEVARLKATGSKLPFEKAAEAFTKVAVDKNFEEFLTLPLYETF